MHCVHAKEYVCFKILSRFHEYRIHAFHLYLLLNLLPWFNLLIAQKIKYFFEKELVMLTISMYNLRKWRKKNTKTFFSNAISIGKQRSSLIDWAVSQRLSQWFSLISSNVVFFSYLSFWITHLLQGSSFLKLEFSIPFSFLSGLFCFLLAS